MKKSISVPDPSLDFEHWLIEWKDEIEQTQIHTKSDLPTDAVAIQPDLNRTTRDFPRMSELLADVDGFLVKVRASETLAVKCDPKFKDLTAVERKAIVDSRLADIVRVRDILRATCHALQERSFALLNQRNWEKAAMGMAGHGDEA